MSYDYEVQDNRSVLSWSSGPGPATWWIYPFPLLFHCLCQIFQYSCITHGSWFIKERKSREIHAKLQFIHGSNFVKLSKRRTKNVSMIQYHKLWPLWSFWIVILLIWHIQKCQIIKMNAYQTTWKSTPSIGICQIPLWPRKGFFTFSKNQAIT